MANAKKLTSAPKKAATSTKAKAPTKAKTTTKAKPSTKTTTHVAAAVKTTPKRTVASKTATPLRDEFMTMRPTRETAYWLIFGLLILALGVWVLTLTIKINNIYDQIESDNSIVIPQTSKATTHHNMNHMTTPMTQ